MLLGVRKHWILIVNLLLFILLLAKNPYSNRTLIPNFEPYPDAIHYIVPARTLVQGGPFLIAREGRYIKPSVPPLYSAFLVPFFIINNDSRFFYFANVFLAIGGLILLYAIINKLLFADEKKSSSFSFKLSTFGFLTFFSLFLYVTNYFIYWYPSLAMAENLTLFLFLVNLYLMIIPSNKFTIIAAAITPFCFFLTKYANFPLTATFLLMYLIKMGIDGLANKKKSDKRFKLNLLFFGGSVMGMLIILIYLEALPGMASIKSLFGNLVPPASKSAVVSSGGGWFSVNYMKEYLPAYIRALFGGYSLHFLWDTTPIWPVYVGVPGVLGLIFGLFKSKTRLIASTLLLSLLSSIIFMSAFYAQDMRYLYFAIPTLLIGFVIFWDTALSFRPKLKSLTLSKALHYTFWGLLLMIFLIYFATSTIRLKKQIMLNLKYAENPWYYLSVIKLNEYFKDYPKNRKEPVVISAMIPYYIDFYSNGEYALLPLSASQEFRNEKEAAWGKFDYSDLIMLYTKILYSGHAVYVHNYGIGNEKPLQDDFQKIKDNFILTKVADGCFDACNIWQVRIKYPLKRNEEVK